MKISNESNISESIRKVVKDSNAKVFQLRWDLNFDSYVQQDTIAMNLHDKVKLNVVDFIISLIVNENEMQIIKADLILDSYFKNLVLYSFKDIDDIKCENQSDFILFMKKHMKIKDLSKENDNKK